MKKALLLLLPALMFGESLKYILEYASQNNNLLEAKKLTKSAKEHEVASKKSDYFPKIDIGASYQNSTDTTLFQIQDIYTFYGKVGVDIYDGGAKSALLKRAKDELGAASYDVQETKEALLLNVVKDFYTLKTLQARLSALEDAKRSLWEQKERVRSFYDAKMATQDDVARLQASYDQKSYEIESLHFEILRVKKSLTLQVGREIEDFEPSVFNESISYEPKSSLKSLEHKESALKSGAEALESVYAPNIKLEERYTLYEYGDIASNHPAKIDKQNVLMLNLNMRIFDNATAKEAKEALLLDAKALNEEIKYHAKEQKMLYELSIARTASLKSKIKSAKSALVAATSAFTTINEKYSAGIVDYVVYLDALSAKTDALSLYESSLCDLQIAYATSCFYGGKKLQECVE
ncbi:TolC family protein [Sulfurimonas sp.]|uniref:TolC family protein n=1 Tax=Sulfurimonas sp. TaxID=2022749 RepID=UPI0026145909|nr:TolC family protein [Sulfurimonas sp.]MDD3451207.1 TolC family protein [Sulfurimonas sp.]